MNETPTMSFAKRSITEEAAFAVIRASAAKAEEMGMKVCIAVVDDSGDTKSFLRMDGAPKLAINIATNKAYTAAAYGISTEKWWHFIKEDPALLHGITNTPQLVVFGGGIPVVEDGVVIGGVGVSGGHYSQDIEVAKAGLIGIGLPEA